MNEQFLNSDSKTSILKQKILGLCINEDNYSIADLSRELGASIPTITKMVGELIEDGFIEDKGKQGTNGGRRPSIYGLNPSAGFFVGTDIRRESIGIAITDFKGHLIDYYEDIPFILESYAESFRSLCSLIKEYLVKSEINENKVISYGFNLTGRVNSVSGHSFSFFIGENSPIASVLEKELGVPVHVENDSRSMAYGEFICGACKNESNVLFLNVSWGLGMGMIIDGKLSYGKSGFSGEIGHFPMMDNDQICRCGKTGCLETAASGSAAHRILTEKLKEGRQSVLADKFNAGETINLDDIIYAIDEEDVLTIEVIEEIGSTLGRAIAGLINIFNPDLVVVGGALTAAQEYLQMPIKSAIRKHSLNIVSKDTALKFSKLGKKGGPIGACMLSRSKFLGLV